LFTIYRVSDLNYLEFSWV